MVPNTARKTLSHLALGALLALASPATRELQAAHADVASQAGAAAGRHDGAEKGREKGRSEGFMRALTDARIDGFLIGLHDRPHEDAIEDARDAGWDEGFRVGEELGREAGWVEGRERSAASYGQLRGRPLRPSFEAPAAPQVSSPGWDECGRPENLVISFSGCRSVSLDPRRLEHGGGPFPHGPEAKIASLKRRRDAARRDGFSEKEDVEAWAAAYKRAYGPAYLSAYRQRQLDLPRHRLRWQRHEGRRDGRAESLRRSACRAREHGFRRGLERAHDEAYRDSARAGWDEVAAIHDTQAVLRVRSAELVESSGDGVLEPGEAVRLRAVIANHGMVDADDRGMDLRSEVGLSGGAHLAQGLRAQESVDEERSLGSVDEGAQVGSSVVVSLHGPDGRVEGVSAVLERPVAIRDIAPRFEGREGHLVLAVRASLESIARLPTDRGLSLSLAGESVEVGVMQAGERRDITLVQALSSSSAFQMPSTGQVILTESAGPSWGALSFDVLPSIADAVGLVAKLDDADEAIEFVRRQLSTEFLEAQSQPKLYKKRGSRSALARYVSAARVAPESTQRRLVAEVSRPLLEAAEARGTPRKVRRAVRKALR